MVTPAYIKEQSRLSPDRYGRPGITEELRETGLDIAHHRAGRPLSAECKFNIAPNLPDRDFTAGAPSQKWPGDIGNIWPRERWCIWRWVWICIPGASSPSHGLQGQTTAG